MEWKIGEIKQVNGEWYQCVVAIDGCRECSFRTQDYCTRHSECFSAVRNDGISVIFKKLEKVGEPYEFDGHLFQSYRTFEVPIFTENYATVRPLGNNSKISIEIKQTKEDMEEEKIQHYDCFFDRKPTLKEFDLEAAKAGKPVCTRDGRKARIICFDAKGDPCPIIALVEENNIESAYRYDKNGQNAYKKSELDLMMLPEKKEGWVNVLEGTAGKVYVGNDIYRTEDEAKEGAPRFTSKLIASVPIEWEE